MCGFIVSLEFVSSLLAGCFVGRFVRWLVLCFEKICSTSPPRGNTAGFELLCGCAVLSLSCYIAVLLCHFVAVFLRYYVAWLVCCSVAVLLCCCLVLSLSCFVTVLLCCLVFFCCCVAVVLSCFVASWCVPLLLCCCMTVLLSYCVAVLLYCCVAVVCPFFVVVVYCIAMLLCGCVVLSLSRQHEMSLGTLEFVFFLLSLLFLLFLPFFLPCLNLFSTCSVSPCAHGFVTNSTPPVIFHSEVFLPFYGWSLGYLHRDSAAFTLATRRVLRTPSLPPAFVAECPRFWNVFENYKF